MPCGRLRAPLYPPAIFLRVRRASAAFAKGPAKSRSLVGGRVLFGKIVDDLHRLDADADDLADEADDVLFVVGVVGIAGDAAALVGFTWYWSMTQTSVLRLPRR